MDSTINQVLSEMEKMNEKFDQRFDQMEGRFEKIDTRFDHVDARFEKVDARFDQVDARFEKMDERFDQMDARFEHLEEGVKYLKIGQDEAKMMLKASLEAVEKTNAELVNLRNESDHKFEQNDKEHRFFEQELRDTNLKLADHSRELRKLKFEKNHLI
ncbi:MULTISPECIES: hypothetical protein [unclassified Bacillus (in: firmicutes)]|uniref:hypothetical protein n=1 Tax=unclassified Bacillus (in: firmicutes) TaxID=185979 RepID=UPI0008E403DE|nr:MULTISPECIES: hypothetical protein [unclassified Bacillus (in: firmicutes)]SFA86685.1 hypothetical protein SAMN02799634_102151 [Bacillus sp. UNCCL13]SFQ83814.1 hypothetical protein SAMN04488577_2272 [Bacillus sp. cl95]